MVDCPSRSERYVSTPNCRNSTQPQRRDCASACERVPQQPAPVRVECPEHRRDAFDALRRRLDAEGIEWTSLTREAEWPAGPEQIGLSTMHSAKGLEFDHVILLGYNAEVVPHGEEEGDALLEAHRRLLAMAIGRARRSVVLGYKPADASALIECLDPDTFDRVDL